MIDLAPLHGIEVAKQVHDLGVPAPPKVFGQRQALVVQRLRCDFRPVLSLNVLAWSHGYLAHRQKFLPARDVRGRIAKFDNRSGVRLQIPRSFPPNPVSLNESVLSRQARIEGLALSYSDCKELRQKRQHAPGAMGEVAEFAGMQQTRTRLKSCAF